MSDALTVVNYLIEFYISLIAYYVLHMIFVISSDFVEAFNIPPLNIGIYVDKLAAIRALLMVLADIIEWQCLDKWAGDYGRSQEKLLGGARGASPRRLGSIASYLGMLSCRVVYLILIYKSDNKSLSVFITLCIEGFWFGAFQMSFFAIGPQYNAVTSLGIHTMGNFIFFLQLYLQHKAKKKPKINSLYRVRAHGWTVVINSLLALGCWLYFLIMVDGNPLGTEFDALVTALSTNVGQFEAGEANSVSASTIAGKLKGSSSVGLGNNTVQTKVKDLVVQIAKKFGLYDVSTTDINVKNNGTTVDIGDTSGGSGQTASANVKVNKLGDEDTEATVTTVSVKQSVDAKTQARAKRLAWTVGDAIAKALQDQKVKDRVKSQLGDTDEAAKKEVDKYSCSATVADANVTTNNVWSPFWLFIVGAFAEDFAVPGVLPFAFLDPEKANLVNYLTPFFFMTGASVIVFLNDVFSESGPASSLDSKFKDWSEGDITDGIGWHGLWALNIPKYIAFFIAMFSIHGTFDRLRCIIQSRWRVLLLTMFVVVPRATLEVAGYVGVANFAILAHDIGDFNQFQYIAYHDMMAMFCRFVYGKFAVGYNWTRVSLGYCLPKFRPRHKGFGFGFWWWVGRTLSRAWADTVKDFKADIKCYL